MPETNPVPPTVMLVDDLLPNLRLLTAILNLSGYRLVTATRGEEALQLAAQSPPDLILLDINMPGMDGYEVCRQLKQDPALKSIPVLFISALTETDDKVQALKAGGVDYVTKPFQVEEVRARVETHLKLAQLQKQLERQNLHLEKLVEAKVKELAESHLSTIFALAKLTENRDTDTGKHVERVRTYSRLLASGLRRQPGFSSQINDQFVADIYLASPLHDIGKVAITDAILLKAGRLSPTEFEVMKTHTVIGAETLRAVLEQHKGNSLIAMGMDIARSHHEQWCGKGYPDGLRREAIPLAARIMAVADVYDALRNKRSYKPEIAHERVCAMLIEMSGTHFEPAIVDEFLMQSAEWERLSDELADREPDVPPQELAR